MTTASIVHYNSSSEELERVITCLLREDVQRIWLVDHSPHGIPSFPSIKEDRLTIIREANTGFGAGHNTALREAMEEGADYHVAVNPDVFWEDDIITILRDYMDKHPEAGLMLPKVLYPDGELQYVCKRLPTPADLIIHRFLNCRLFHRHISRFRLEHSGYDNILDVPFLHGCFMLMRISALKKVGIFDERFFLYLEDTDMCRRIHEHYATIFFPGAKIYHAHAAASRSNLKMLAVHTRNAVKYFNKWGWIYDKKRKEANRRLEATIRETKS